ncbi:MAG: hypothetical protein NVS1B6_05760 [Steroidobacteraceae bacterium]
MAASSCPRVLILGAGFGGIGVVKSLRRQMKPAECAITLIDQYDHSLDTPMLTEAAGGEVDAGAIVAPIRSLIGRKVTFEQGYIMAIDPGRRIVTMCVSGADLGIPTVIRELEYDHLVIALGSVTNFHGISGLEEHSVTAKTLTDAVTIRNRALALLERADEEEDVTTRRNLLTFVIGGGGFSGVETAAALNEMVRDLAREFFPRIGNDDIRMLIAHPGESLLPELSARLGRYTERELTKRGVEVRLHTVVEAAGPNWVELKPVHGSETERITCHTIIWTGGVQPNPVVHSSGLRLGKHGGVVADSTCAVADTPGVWALGDCAEIPIPGKSEHYAPTAQNAIRQGKHVGKNIAACLRGRAPTPVDYTAVGELALVGKRAGVASVFGLRFSGLLAWAMWRAIYLEKLPSFPQRVRVALDWFLDALSGREVYALPGPHSRQQPDKDE